MGSEVIDSSKKKPVDRQAEEDKQKSVASLIQSAMDRFDESASSYSSIRAKSLDDIKFSHNDDNYQWPQVIWQERIKWKRPCLVINQIPKFVRSVTNETRQNRPGIEVHPVDSGADVDTAEVIAGLIRHIEYDSDASIAYDNASDFQVRGGFGYFRILADYSNPLSFEQDLKIKRIKNPFSVYYDPDAQEPDYSDARYCIIVEDMSVEKYKSKYPNSKLAGLSSFSATGNAEQWATKDNIRTAEYFYFETEDKEIYQLTDGTVVDKKPQDETLIANSRMTQAKKLKWCKLNAIEILEETDLPIPYIPVIPVIGEECDIDGKRMIKGMVRDAQDPQKQYNFMASAQTETIALAPKSPFVAAEGQIENYEGIWKTANTENHSVLPYKPVSLEGHPVPAPRRESTEPAVQAITQARRESAEDLKSVTGIYDASLGARSNETSGKAIRARQAEGDTQNYHYGDNLRRSIRACGRILVAWIPYIYDTARTIRILGEDMASKVVKINSGEGDFEEGQKRIYNVLQGKYDVTISNGPAFNTKREMAVDMYGELIQSVPELFKVAGDLLVGNMDLPGAPQLAKRLKKMMPPEIQAMENEGKGDVPPEIQQQMAQMAQMIEQMTQALNKANNELDSNHEDNQSKERIALLNSQTQLTIAYMKAESDESKAIFMAEMQSITSRLNRLNALEDQQTQAEMAAQQNPVDMASGSMSQNGNGDMASGASSAASNIP